jgi:hypothetical protein
MIKIGNLQLKPSSTTPHIYIGREGVVMFIRVGIEGVELLSMREYELPKVLGVDME